MDIISFLANTNVAGDPSVCTETALNTIIVIAKVVLNIIRILVPIALIVLGTIDIGKAVIEGDEKKIKEAQKPFVKRVIAAVIVFLIPWIVDIVMNIVGSDTYRTCWNNAEGGISDIKNIINGND